MKRLLLRRVKVREAKRVVNGSHDGGILRGVDEWCEGEGVAVEEVEVESVSGRVEVSVAVREDLGGEESEEEQRRDEAKFHCFLEKLPCEWDVILPEDVGDEAVRELRRR